MCKSLWKDVHWHSYRKLLNCCQGIKCLSRCSVFRCAVIYLLPRYLGYWLFCFYRILKCTKAIHWKIFAANLKIEPITVFHGSCKCVSLIEKKLIWIYNSLIINKNESYTRVHTHTWHAHVESEGNICRFSAVCFSLSLFWDSDVLLAWHCVGQPVSPGLCLSPPAQCCDCSHVPLLCGFWDSLRLSLCLLSRHSSPQSLLCILYILFWKAW